ncbi:PrpF domain-containing protein [Streptomyces sp. NPDC008125]|uniref:PrpF domain-containing protein n=1 Tax=Streptomyces sp. NPDC008125 TaxID=3364811 RepID=UPI0036EFFAA1
MIGYLAEASGAPCPTLVLDAEGLPRADHLLRPLLTEVRRQLVRDGHQNTLKIALISASPHPLFDLDYRFVQCLPESLDAVDFHGSCGHSIVASVLVAGARRLVARPAPGDRVRLRVLNNGDHIVCEVDESRRGSGSFTLHLVQQPGTALSSVLMTGRPLDRVTAAGAEYDVSLVSLGNPYVFVDAQDLGLHTRAALFGAGREVFEEMQGIRRAASAMLEMDPAGVFPKVAAVGSYEQNRLSARAISVPSWHPTLALTGTTCLATAATVPGTVPGRLHRGTAQDSARIEIDTAGGRAVAEVRSDHQQPEALLQWVSVRRKQARLLSGPFAIGPDAPLTDLVVHPYDTAEEATSWTPLTV